MVSLGFASEYRQIGINEEVEIANSTYGGLVFRAATTTLYSQAVPQSCLRRVATKVNPSRIPFAIPNGSNSVATQPFRYFVPHPCSGMSAWRVRPHRLSIRRRGAHRIEAGRTNRGYAALLPVPSHGAPGVTGGG